MTTTHTFQGLNTDSKPSSRVLNPPGGSSSNIFGTDDLAKQTSIKSIPESGSRSRNVTSGHDLPAATAGTQQKSWAPRSGAFNPITGEPYEQAKPKPEPQIQSTVSAESSKTLVACTSATATEHVSGSATSTLHDKQEAAPESTSCTQLKQQQQSGIFNNATSGTKEHTSTRVSQPPGGRSSKLW